MTSGVETAVIHEFRSVHGECPEVPDGLSIPQFFLDSWHPLRPTRPAGSPWVIDDESGKTLDYEQVRLALVDPLDHLLTPLPSDPIAELRSCASSQDAVAYR